jgi:hypothetical protein
LVYYSTGSGVENLYPRGGRPAISKVKFGLPEGLIKGDMHGAGEV